jgi:serine/threonine-protein kinase
MQPDRWEQLAELFERITAVPPAGRSGVLDENCGEDTELRRELLSLLAAHAANSGPLDSAPNLQIHSIDETAAADEVTEVGPYRLLREIGAGGMGTVWLAERSDGLLKRRVALKLPHMSWLGSLTQRMAQERDILASLEHPNIARLYDAGVTQHGRPYLALEYIEGVPITEFCNRGRLNVRRRLELFLQVLDAVRYAHAHLVIHRDIKPSNILVTPAGRVHLLDFGIAKLLGTEIDSGHTQLGFGIATPDYAAPEQVDGRNVSTATDVYSLGVLLSELLTGRRPYLLDRESRSAIERAILEAEPILPSRCLAPESAHLWDMSATALIRGLRGDLDCIVLACLRKKPEDRYATVDQLAQDINRHLRGEPIVARTGGASYHAMKFLRRHKVAVGSMTGIVVALVVGLAFALWQADRAADQSRRAEVEARTSHAVEAFLRDIFLANTRAQTDPLKARETTARELLSTGVRKIDGALLDAPAAKLRLLKMLADLQHQLALDDEAVALNRKQVALAGKLYGPDSPRVAEALVDLSSTLMSTQANDEREPVLMQALAILDRNHDTSSQLRGNLLGELAQWAYAYNLDKALEYAQSSVRILRAYPASPDLTEALIMEGVTRSVLGQNARAEELLTESVSVATATEGPLATKLTRIYAYRADTRYYEGDWDGAGQDLQEAYRVANQLGGAQDMQTIQIQQRLGLFLLRTSRAKEARPYVEQARTAVLKVSSADDAWFVPMTLETSGLVLGELGDLEEGLRDLGAAVRGWRKHHAGSADVISGCEREANLLIAAGRLHEAEAGLNEAAAVRTSLHDFATNLNGGVIGRTNLLIASGRAAEAPEVMKSFVVKDEHTGAVSVHRLQRAIQTARIELALAHPDAVIEALREVRQTAAGSPLRPFLKSYEADADYLAGAALLMQDRPAGALPLLRHAHELYAEIFDQRLSLKLADSKIALADTLLRLGQRAEARRFAGEAAAIHAVHPQLGDQYKKPLRAVQVRLART